MSKAFKNKLEQRGAITYDSTGLSGADLEQQALLAEAEASVGPGNDGARLEQLAGDEDE